MHTSLVWILALASIVAMPAAASEPPAHAGADCALCHSGGEMDLAAVSSRCRDCHASTADTGSNALHLRTDCATCHGFHDTDLMRTREGEFARADLTEATLDQCRVCHGRDGGFVKVGTGHWNMRIWYHASVSELSGLTRSEACLQCHEQGSAPPAMVNAGASLPRFHRSASHPYGEAYPSGRQGFAFDLRETPDAALELVDGKIECTTCHDLRREENDLLAATANPNGICDGCHVRREDPWSPGVDLVAR